MSKIILMSSAWRQIYKRIKKQGYVWIKTENGFITKDDVPNYCGFRTVWYRISLVQKDYEKTFALTKEELE